MTSLWSGLISARPGRILALLIVITAGAILSATRLRVDDSWIKNLPPRSEVAQGDQVLNHVLAGTTTLDLVVDTGEPSGFLRSQSIQFLLAIEDRLSALPFVGAGGDGAVTAGDIIAGVCASEGLHIIKTEAYGPQIRGGDIPDPVFCKHPNK